MKSVGIVYNPDKSRAVSELKKIKVFLKQKGCKIFIISSKPKKMPKLDMALTLGGDGTMLRAGKLFAPYGIPVLGVNLGSLGFLAETKVTELYRFLSGVISGKFSIEKRIMIGAEIFLRKRKISDIALNDIIIHSGTNRVISIGAFINDEFLGNYIGDGLILATPTGSTAYSLAASGPIVYPNLKVFVLTPICPHTLTQRPLIISAGETITLKINTINSKDKPVLCVDGQKNYTLDTDNVIKISAYKMPLNLIVNPRRKYFTVLRSKLKWSERG